MPLPENVRVHIRLGGRERGVLEDCTEQNQLGGWLFRGKEALARLPL